LQLSHSLLELDGGAKGINGAEKLNQSTVAGQLDQTATVFRQDRIEMLGTVLAQACQCAALVPSHEAGVANNVSGQDRQFALFTDHGNFPRLLTGG
jgi:hypothetical protein